MTPCLIEARSAATLALLACFTEKPAVAAKSSSLAGSSALLVIPSLSCSWQTQLALASADPFGAVDNVDTGLLRVPRFRDCFAFFNLDAFGLAPIDRRSLSPHL